MEIQIGEKARQECSRSEPGKPAEKRRPSRTFTLEFKAEAVRLCRVGDRGVQNACGAFRALLAPSGAAQSMNRAGGCYDYAMMESLWASIKKELVHHEAFATRAEARAAVLAWM